jgi:hypothetical protein
MSADMAMLMAAVRELIDRVSALESKMQSQNDQIARLTAWALNELDHGYMEWITKFYWPRIKSAEDRLDSVAALSLKIRDKLNEIARDPFEMSLALMDLLEKKGISFEPEDLKRLLDGSVRARAAVDQLLAYRESDEPLANEPPMDLEPDER